MNTSKPSFSWEELLDSIETASSHPVDTAWDIYRYLKQNYKAIGSKQVRTLLAGYLKLPVEKPSLIHSCMLDVAVRISGEYDDFQFPQFLKMWGYDANLREEDRQRQTGKDGKQYISLKERAERRLQSYMLHHAAEGQKDIEGIKPMYAVKVFESMANGKRRYFVKLVAPDGMELTADSHLFPCKPWEIQGKLYDVLLRTSKQGNVRAVEVVLSKKRVGEVFPTVVGYVDGVDESHGHYHVYDALSRHFVAEKPKMMIRHGDFVVFSPVIPAADKFKSAAVVSVMKHDEGLAAFGAYAAVVTYLNPTDGYLRYRITSPLKDTPEGVMTAEGFASLVYMKDDELRKNIKVGDKIRLLLFLKRGKDGVKRNHVAEIMYI